MNAYLILDMSINDGEKFREYMMNIPEFIEKHSGHYIIKGGAPKVMEGDWNPDKIVVIEFPSRENAEAFLNDPDAQSLLDIRRHNTTSKLILVDGVAEQVCDS